MGKKTTDVTRTGVQKVRDGLTTSAALGATVTVVGGVLVINGQPVMAQGVNAEIVVTALTDAVADDDVTTLREALFMAGAAAGADTITFDAGLFDAGPANLVVNSPLGVDHDVVITGPGSELLTVQSDGRGVYLYGGASLSLSGVSIESGLDSVSARIGGRRGADVEGAGEPAEAIIAAPGSLTLDDVSLTSTYQSAVDASNISGVSISGSQLVSNGYSYAAQFNEVDSVTITDTEITASPVSGAAVYAYYVDSLMLSGVSISQGVDVEAEVERRVRPVDGIQARYVDALSLVDSSVVGMTGVGVDLDRAESLSIDRSTISGNGRGAVEAQTSSGTTITNSTIADNGADADLYRRGPGAGIVSVTSSDGGDFYQDKAEAIQIGSSATLTVSNSTITGNEVSNGEALLSVSTRNYFPVFGAAADAKELTGYESMVVLNSTISGNVSEDGDNYASVLQIDNPVAVDHSIVTDNGSLRLLSFGLPQQYAIEGEDEAAQIFPINPVSITRSILPADAGESDRNEGVLESATDDANVFADDALLGPLADNGGLTLTMLPQPGSPAIDAGSAADSTAAVTAEDVDQRGASRVSGADLDIGAVETRIDMVDVSVPDGAVAESDGSVDVTVTRTGDGEGEASVRLSTTDGSATAGSDFTAVDQVVMFADGETGAKVVAVTITVDDATESDETFTVALSDPTNLAVGTESADVTITDDSVPTTEPPTTEPPTTEPPTTEPPTTEPPVTVPPTTVPSNAAPEVTPTPNSGVRAGDESVIMVVIEDADGDDLDVQATSSNPALLSVVSVRPSAGGGGALVRASYDITVRAAAGASGTATLTVTANDGTTTTTQTIDVQVSNATLPATGSDATTPTVALAGLLLAAGAGATAMSRRRKLT